MIQTRRNQNQKRYEMHENVEKNNLISISKNEI